MGKVMLGFMLGVLFCYIGEGVQAGAAPALHLVAIGGIACGLALWAFAAGLEWRE